MYDLMISRFEKADRRTTCQPRSSDWKEFGLGWLGSSSHFPSRYLLQHVLPVWSRGSFWIKGNKPTWLIDRPPYNLNEMAHDATMHLIRQVLNSQVQVNEVKKERVWEEKRVTQTRYTTLLHVDLCWSCRSVTVVQGQTISIFPRHSIHYWTSCWFALPISKCGKYLCQGNTWSDPGALDMDRVRSWGQGFKILWIGLSFRY